MNTNITNKLINDLKLKPYDLTKSSNEKQKIKCLLCNKTFEATPKSKIMNHKKFGSIGCPECSLNSSFNFKKEEIILRLKNKGFQLMSEYKGIKDKTKVSYDQCPYHHTWSDIPANLVYRDNGCKICRHLSNRASEIITGISNREYINLIKRFLNHFSDFKIETDYTIDRYKSTFKFNNVAVFLVPINNFRQNVVKDKKYFIKMMKTYENNGIRLLIIYETEYRDKEVIITSKIRNILHRQNLPSIMARKCTIREIDGKSKSKFLNDHHIQGNSPSNIDLGAFYENKLVAVMTFIKPRVLMGFKNKNYDNIYELARYASDNNFRISGMGSKLLKHFKNNYNWEEIFSYADLRWSSGDLYYKLGFELVQTASANYHYIIDGKIMHRWGYRKDKLKELFPDRYDPKLTEYENMLNFGYDRIWDCGNYKFVLTKIKV